MSNAGKRWMARVARVPCVVCGAWPVEVHHCRTGAGLSQRSEDFLTVALCPEHHRGASGVHGLGRKGFYARYKRDEMDLLASTIEAVAKGMP